MGWDLKSDGGERQIGREERGRERGTHPEILTFLDIISPNRGTARREIDIGLIMRPDSGSSRRCTSFHRHERVGVERIRKSRHEFLWRVKRD